MKEKNLKGRNWTFFFFSLVSFSSLYRIIRTSENRNGKKFLSFVFSADWNQFWQPQEEQHQVRSDSMTGGKMDQDRMRKERGEDEERDGEKTSDRFVSFASPTTWWQIVLIIFWTKSQGPNYTTNEYLQSLKSDHLYHLALDTSTHDFKEMFGDVKFICVGGTLKRMESFAYFVGQELGIKLPTGVALKDITQNAHRYSMFKIGPVLSVTVSIN